MSAQPIVFWNRALKREETELVYGDAGVRLLYGTFPGKWVADRLLARKLPSVAYGAYQASGLSRRKIEPFARAFKIPMEDYLDESYGSFNDFFIRRFKPGKRPFETDPRRLPAFAEARYLAFEQVKRDDVFPVKGSYLSPERLLAGSEHARAFEGGPLLLARLCPVDYHRYHYPDAGRTLAHFTVHGKFHSVNPAALRYSGEIFATNERRVAVLETKGFGKLAYVEVGAMMVGRIVQTHAEDRPFERGAEKGYFLFGASTVIVLGEPGAWRPDADLLEQTRARRETLVRLGDAIASRL